LARAQRNLRTSINGGVLASPPALLKRCANRTEFIITALREDGVTAADWQVEQFALSVAVGEIGFTPLDDRWNVTPVSPVDDRDVAFWHYNDSIEPTRRLKQSLDCPASVAELLRNLMSVGRARPKCFDAFIPKRSRRNRFNAPSSVSPPRPLLYADASTIDGDLLERDVQSPAGHCRLVASGGEDWPTILALLAGERSVRVPVRPFVHECFPDGARTGVASAVCAQSSP
jgi:hypothetical protein